MAADILTRRQLEEQLERRQEYLNRLRRDDADPKLIEKVQKDLRLTQRRLERMKE